MAAKAASSKQTKSSKKAAQAAAPVTEAAAAPAAAPAACATGTPSPLLSLSDVAAYLQVAERTVYLWAQQGKLPSFKLGNLWRFRRSDLDVWIEESRKATPRKKA